MRMREFKLLVALATAVGPEKHRTEARKAFRFAVRMRHLLPAEWHKASFSIQHVALYRRWAQGALPAFWFQTVEDVVSRTPEAWMDYIASLSADDASVAARNELLQRLLELKGFVANTRYFEIADSLAAEARNPESTGPANESRPGSGVTVEVSAARPSDAMFFTRAQKTAFTRILALADLYFCGAKRGAVIPRTAPLLVSPTGAGKTAVVSRVAQEMNAVLVRVAVAEWIPAELWERANAAIAPRTSLPARRAERDKHNSLLKGIIFCDNCGAALTPHPTGKIGPDGKRYLYYMCTKVTKHGTASDCTLRSLPAREVEALVVRLMSELGRHPEVIAETIAAVERRAKTDTRPAKAELQEVEKQLRKATQRVEHLLSIAKENGAGAFSREAMADAEKAAAEKERLASRAAQLKVEIGGRSLEVMDAETVAMQLRDFGDLFEQLEPEEKKELVRLLIREVRVNHVEDKKPQVEAKEGSAGLQFRNKRFVLNISFFATGLFSEIKRTGVKHFDFGPKWLPE